MENGSPALFKRGLPLSARLAFFASLSAILMLVDGKLQTLESFRSAISAWLIRPAEALAEGSINALSGASKFFTTVEALSSENEALREKNAKLAFELSEMRQVKAGNAQLMALAGVKSRIKNSSAVGQISGETADAFSRRVEINLGSESGIEPGMPVIDEDGIVGQVNRISANRSEVKLLTDPTMQFPVLLPRTGLRCATAYSQNGQTVELRFVPAAADVVEGDEVQTSGIDRIFPAGLSVGKVSKVEKVPGDAFAHVWVQLSSAPALGRYVMVVLVNTDPASQGRKVIP